MSAKRILIATEATLGMGHKRAAEALKIAIEREAPDSEVALTTALVPQAEALFNHLYGQALSHMPYVWGAAYASERVTSTLFKHAFGMRALSRARSIVEHLNPDIVITTHALSVPAFARLKRQYPFFLAVAVTDFDANGFWINRRRVDRYFVAHAEVAARISRRYRLPLTRFVPSGIPIDPLFADPALEMKAKGLRRALQIPADEPLIVLMGGGEGLLDMAALIQALDALPNPFVLTAVTGRNAALRAALERLNDERRLRHRLIVRGYVTDAPVWLAAADIIFTKPGGLTLSEVLALGKPAVLFQPIPGQETRNVRFIMKHGAALLAPDIDEAAAKLRTLLCDPAERNALSARARALGKPDAAREIVRTLFASTTARTAPVVDARAGHRRRSTTGSNA
ncbi:MAG: glycosyltransferase [Hydrogenibacillus sp.]|nr:glycosyltransferase [Hydrogenibacillus sp.]